MKKIIMTVLCSLFFMCSVTQAGTIVGGDTTPDTAAAWESSSNGSSTVGDSADGTLIVSAGSDIYSYTVFIGDDSGATGTVTVSGDGSTWTNTATSSSHYNFFIGHYGTGYLNIEDKAIVTTAGRSYLGRYAGSAGHLDITGGGKMYSGRVAVGFENGATSTVSVSGLDSLLACSDNFFVGESGSGILNITNGATLTNAIGMVGNYPSASGTVNVSGTGSSWLCSSTASHYIGNNGTGMLNISESGLVGMAGILNIDNDGDGDSFVNMSTGGMLALPGDLDDDLTSFLTMVSDDSALRYWNGLAWDSITNAQKDVDYTLSTQDYEGTTFTVLTVGTATVPEPGSIALLLTALAAIGFIRKLKR